VNTLSNVKRTCRRNDFDMVPLEAESVYEIMQRKFDAAANSGTEWPDWCRSQQNSSWGHIGFNLQRHRIFPRDPIGED
tara:strand:- start:139 stop:372 length:234 start_codon:yes stop_codon:yes gene_type:complete